MCCCNGFYDNRYLVVVMCDRRVEPDVGWWWLVGGIGDSDNDHMISYYLPLGPHGSLRGSHVVLTRCFGSKQRLTARL